MKTVVGRDVCSRAASPLKWLGFFVDAVDAVAAKLLVTVSSKAIGVEGSSRRRRRCLVVFVRCCCVVVVLLLSLTLHALSLFFTHDK